MSRTSRDRGQHDDSFLRALTIRGDPFESHDPVFGMKASLVVDLTSANSAIAQKYGVKPDTKLLQYHFVLVSSKEAADLRAEQAKGVMGEKIEFIDGRPVPAV